MSKKTSLPPLNPLHVFEVASRLESFTRAADELNVTQSAVSRQIGTLESSLNVMLFRRGKKGISLTDAGDFYRREIGAAFARIEAATEELRSRKAAGPLRVRVYSSFAATWLIPRMSVFREKHPSIELQMNTAVQPVDFSRDGADVAIQFGSGDWPGTISRRIISDVLQPVCSPALIRRVGGIDRLEDLHRVPLIAARLRSRDWKDWLLDAGADPDAFQYMEFPSSLLAYEAAAAGLGVTMGQLALVQTYLNEGQLQPVLDRRLCRDLGYYAIWSASIPVSTKMRAFLHWLEFEARKQDWLVQT